MPLVRVSSLRLVAYCSVMCLYKDATCAPVLLEARADTQETLRFNTTNGSFGNSPVWIYLQIRANGEQEPIAPSSSNLLYRGSKSPDLYKLGLGQVLTIQKTATLIPLS